jgi:hypothetical protein
MSSFETGAPPFPLVEDLRVCLVYDFAHFRERLPAPAPSSLIFSSMNAETMNAEADSTGTGVIFDSGLPARQAVTTN